MTNQDCVFALQTLPTMYIRPIPTFIDYGPKTKRYGVSVSVRTEPKVGRNEQCPCGCGKKSKKCNTKKK